jgi:hypothetical protein
VLALLTAFLIVPVSAWRASLYATIGSPFELVLFAFMLGSFGGFFWFGQRQGKRLVLPLELLSAIALGVGITLHCALASLAGLFGGPAVFVRTPKTGGGVPVSGKLESKEQPALPGACFVPAVFRHKKESLMVLYLGSGMIYLALKWQYLTLPFVLLILAGYLMILFVATEYECTTDL